MIMGTIPRGRLVSEEFMFTRKPDTCLTCNQMNPYIKNPKILLLKCSIEYLYREETKFTCIDPIVLQVSKSL